MQEEAEQVVERMQSYRDRRERKQDVREGVYLAPGGSLTLFESHAWGMLELKSQMTRNERTSPSKMPSPVVAQLGSTFHTWSLAILSNCSRSETSLGRIADWS